MINTALLNNNELKKLQAEVAAWKQTLTSRMEANVLLKNMLSDVLKNNYDQNYLEEIEEFQTKFIQEDEKTNVLRKQVTDLDNLLSGKTFNDRIISESFEEIMKRFRNDFTHSRNRFRFLVSSFADFHYKIYGKNEN
ncbi:MAG: hypothetical protein ABI325_04085 [Ginsengibacter sp.]